MLPVLDKMPNKLRSVAAATALSLAFSGAATTVCAQDRTPPSASVRAAIARDAARLGYADVRHTTWDQAVPNRHLEPRGAVAIASRQDAVQRERSWVGRHPALTGALIGAAGGATYAYIMCRGACEGQPGLYMTLFGGVGAGIGAVIGAGTGAIVGALRR